MGKIRNDGNADKRFKNSASTQSDIDEGQFVLIKWCFKIPVHIFGFFFIYFWFFSNDGVLSIIDNMDFDFNNNFNYNFGIIVGFILIIYFYFEIKKNFAWYHEFEGEGILMRNLRFIFSILIPALVVFLFYDYLAAVNW